MEKINNFIENISSNYCNEDYKEDNYKGKNNKQIKKIKTINKIQKTNLVYKKKKQKLNLPKLNII